MNKYILFKKNLFWAASFVERNVNKVNVNVNKVNVNVNKANVNKVNTCKILNQYLEKDIMPTSSFIW